jgi:hypothetical protein
MFYFNLQLSVEIFFLSIIWRATIEIVAEKHLGHYVTSRKVVGSISDITGFFN